MHVEWQGDHRLLGDDVKQDLERELTRLELDPSKFLVEVRREPDLPGADGLYAIRYDVYITDLEHPDRDTRKLHFSFVESLAAVYAERFLSGLFAAAVTPVAASVIANLTTAEQFRAR